MRYFHGTDYESGMQILKQKSFSHTSTIWACSDSRQLYIVSEKYDNDIERAINFAIEAAQIAAAHKGSNNTSVIVFEFDIPDNFLNDRLYEDGSSENMIDCYEYDTENLDADIKSGAVKMTCWRFEDAYEPYIRPFYLANLSQSYCYQHEDERLNRVLKCIEKIDTVEIYESFIGQYSEKQQIPL